MSRQNGDLRKADIRLLAAVPILLLAASSRAAALPTVLTFEGLQDLEFIDNYYDGGLGSLGSGPGPSQNVTFVNSQSLISIAAGGNGNFDNNPSGFTVAFFFSDNNDIMNVAGGFDTGLAFFYAAAFGGSVDIFSGLNGTGALLAHLDLAPTPLGDFPATYNTWLPTGVAFQGTAMSVDFSGAANFIGFDNMTLGSAVTLPEGTGVAAELLGGFALLAASIRLRRGKESKRGREGGFRQLGAQG